MKYNFDEVINRAGTSAEKVDGMKEIWGRTDLIPLWVADMDFATPPYVINAIRKRCEHPILGYTAKPESYYRAITDWVKRRYGMEIETKHLNYVPGIVPGLGMALNCFTRPEEKVMIMPPVYHPFAWLVKRNNRRLVECPLQLTDGHYRMDLEAFRRNIEGVRVFILCNPHNPIGKVWEKDVLERIGSLCEQYNVLVIADEIHCDITHEKSYTPFASINEQCANSSISTFSPSKTFNIADLHVASTVIPNRTLRQKIQKSFAIDYVSNPNAFGIAASVAAYQYGQKWLKTALHYIVENKKITQDFIHTHLPNLHVIDSHATYLLWIDCSEYVQNTDKFCAFLRKHTGLYVSNGSSFGAGGESFFRLNIACPKTTLLDGLQRLQQGITHFINLL